MGETSKFRFGNGTCPSIEVDAFSPICDYPSVAGSTPLTPNVPAPVFYPVIPPVECACLKFASEASSITVTQTGTVPRKITGTAKVEITPSGDCCGGKYEIAGPTIAINFPECLMNDWETTETYSFNTQDAGYSGSFTVKMRMKDCVPSLSITGTKLTVPTPTITVPPLCLQNTDFTLKVRYKDPDTGNNVEPTTSTVTVTADNTKPCKKYTIEDAIVIDLTELRNYVCANGGSVFMGASDNNLYTDGTMDADSATWYGGGIGNFVHDTANTIDCRGPIMRDSTATYPFNWGTDHPVQITTAHTYKLIKDDSQTSATQWHSWTKSGTNTVEKAHNGYVGGNLSMVLPSGFQWDADGLGLNLSTFVWNPSGLLSRMEETNVAVLVSPAPAKHASSFNTSFTGSSVIAGRNASGLAIYPRSTAAWADTWEPGLVVNDGRGLRVFGKDEKTLTGTGALADLQARLGAIGTLEVYAYDGDFLFNYDDKLVINDEKTETRTILPDDDIYLEPVGVDAPFDRTRDCAVVVGMQSVDSDYWTRPSGKFIWQCTLLGDETSLGRTNETLLRQLGEKADNLQDMGDEIRTSANSGDIFTAITALNNAQTTLEGVGQNLQRLANQINSGNYTQVSQVADAIRALASELASTGGLVPSTIQALAKVPPVLSALIDPVQNSVGHMATAITRAHALLSTTLDWCASWNLGVVHVGKAGTILAINGSTNRPDAADRHYRKTDPTTSNATPA